MSMGVNLGSLGSIEVVGGLWIEGFDRRRLSSIRVVGGRSWSNLGGRLSWRSIKVDGVDRVR